MEINFNNFKLNSNKHQKNENDDYLISIYGKKFLIKDIEKDEPNKKNISYILNKMLVNKYVNFYTVLGKKNRKFITGIHYSRFAGYFYIYVLGKCFILNEEYPIEILDNPKIIISDDDPYGEEDWNN